MAKLEDCTKAMDAIADSALKLHARLDAGSLDEYKAVNSPKMLGRYHMREAHRHSENLVGVRSPEEEANTHAAGWHAKAAHHFMLAHHAEGNEKESHFKQGRLAAIQAENHSAKVKEFEKLRSAQ